jgi:hypothetical protein
MPQSAAEVSTRPLDGLTMSSRFPLPASRFPLCASRRSPGFAYQQVGRNVEGRCHARFQWNGLGMT